MDKQKAIAEKLREIASIPPPILKSCSQRSGQLLCTVVPQVEGRIMAVRGHVHSSTADRGSAVANTRPEGPFGQKDRGREVPGRREAMALCKRETKDSHGGDVSSLLYATPPPSRSGPKAPRGGGGGGGGGGLLGGGGASRRGGPP